MHFQHFTAHFHHIFLHFVESISNSFPNSMRTWKRIHSHNSTNPPTFSPILRIIAKSSERETAESIRSHSPDLPRIDFFAKGFLRVLRIVSTSSTWHKWRSQKIWGILVSIVTYVWTWTFPTLPFVLQLSDGLFISVWMLISQSWKLRVEANVDEKFFAEI